MASASLRILRPLLDRRPFRKGLDAFDLGDSLDFLGGICQLTVGGGDF